MELNKKIIEVLENNDIKVYDVCEQDGEFYVELEHYTPAGEDFVFLIWFDGTNEGFIDKFYEYYQCFDVDEEASIYIENRGNNGIPSSVRTILEDQEYKEEFLHNVGKELNNLDLYE